MNDLGGGAVATIHLIDAENLVGHAPVSLQDAKLLYEAYIRLETFLPTDIILVASAHNSAQALHKAWRSMGFENLRINFLAQSGKDGAEKALLKWVQENFEKMPKRVVLGSGDHFFLKLLWFLRSRHFDVQVISNEPNSSALVYKNYRFELRFLDLQKSIILADLDPRPSVTPNSRFTIAVGSSSNKKVWNYAIVYAADVEVSGFTAILASTRFGKTLLGKHVGDAVNIVRNGKTWVGVIEKIEHF